MNVEFFCELITTHGILYFISGVKYQLLNDKIFTEF